MFVGYLFLVSVLTGDNGKELTMFTPLMNLFLWFPLGLLCLGLWAGWAADREKRRNQADEELRRMFGRMWSVTPAKTRKRIRHELYGL